MADAVVIDADTGEEQRRPLTADETAWKDDIAVAVAADEQAQTDAAAAEQAWRDAVSNASSLVALKDALLGTGLPAQAESRVK